MRKNVIFADDTTDVQILSLFTIILKSIAKNKHNSKIITKFANILRIEKS